MLTANDTVRFTILASPKKEVTGKKRLQKLISLGKYANLPFGVSFRLWNYGPFSREVAQATDTLESLGEIEAKKISIEPYNFLATSYLASGEGPSTPEFHRIGRVMKSLSKYSTVQLEIASTIAFFEDHNQKLDNAIDSTKRMKPQKATPPNVEVALSILKELAAGVDDGII